MTADEMEAQSRKYGNDIIMVLPLSSGKTAVFNSARELLAIVEADLTVLQRHWRRPTTTDVSIVASIRRSLNPVDIGL